MLLDTQGVVECQRCGARCRISGQPGKMARMLRFAEGPGLCVNCAVHDWLRNTYPPNILLAQSGPKVLLFKHIQEQFAEIMRIGFADAKPDEIDWQKIVENWELPFPNKMKPSASNPCSQKEINEVAAGKYKAIDTPPPRAKVLLNNKLVIKDFEQLNELEPGLGDKFKKCLRAE